MLDRSALFVACRTNDVKLLETFVAERPEGEHYEASEDGPFYCAIANNSYQVVEYFLKNQLTDIFKIFWGEDNCLSYALYTPLTNSDMIELLMTYDQNFKLVENIKFILELDFGDKFRTLIEILKARNYTIPKSIGNLAWYFLYLEDPEKLYYFLESENWPLLTGYDAERSKELLISFVRCFQWENFEGNHIPSCFMRRFIPLVWIKCLNKIFSLCFETYADVVPNNLTMLMAVMREFGLTVWLERCIEMALAESNEHRPLFQKLLKLQQNGVTNVDVIISFLSHTSQSMANERISTVFPGSVDHSVIHLTYKQLIKCLVENASKWNSDEMKEIGSAIRPKLNSELFSFVFYECFSEAFVETKAVSNIFQMVDKMGLAEKIQHLTPFISQTATCWVPLMAFSTAVTVYDYLTKVPQYQKERALAIEKEMRIRSKGTNQFQKLWPRVEESGLMAEFRKKNTLKYICRARMREILLADKSETKITHSQLVQNVKLLGLPIELQQFILFNYTDYNF